MNVKYPDYQQSILNVSHTILDYYNAGPKYPSIKELKNILDLGFKHVALVLLDGMGTNIIEKHLDEDAFLRKHTIKKITSVFPPTTVAATNAVLTAKPPIESGYLGWVQYFKKENTNHVVFLNEDFYDSKRTFHNSLREMYLKHKLIYDYIKENNCDVKTYELFPDFRPNGYKTFHLELKKLQEITSKKDKSFSYLYWANPDLLEHEVGIYHESVKTELEKLNRELEDFSKTMNDDTLIIVIADHGLVDVKPIELYKDEELLKLLLRMPSIEPRATNFFVKPFKKHKFKKMFNEKYGNDYKLLSKNELLYSGLLGQGDHHPLVDSFLGDFMAIAISDKYFKFKEGKLFKAHHAGLLEGEMEVPLIVYHKKNEKLD